MSVALMETPAEFRQRIESEPLPMNLGALLDQAVMHYPDRPAWIFVEQDKESISYRELGALVAKSANAFASIGVRKGSHVGVMLPNVPESLAAWLAIAKLGARMVPINPGYTPDELRYLLTDGDAEFLLIDIANLPVLNEVEKKGQILARERIAVYGDKTEPGLHHWTKMLRDCSDHYEPTNDVFLDDIVNIQYTSGSTGFPKGCLLSHRYWLQMGKVKSEAWPKFERIQCDLPFYYMGPLWRFSVAAFQGAALCVPPSYSLSRFVERLLTYRYDFAWMTNPVAMLPPSPRERDNNLKMIVIFGLSKELHRDLERRYGVPVRESWGMTETGVGLYMPLQDAHMSGSGSCGIPCPFREFMITDDNGNPVKVGEIGELCVAGPGILQGYYKKPEATANAFRGKWLRTGDLFRQDTNGYFYIVGRIKDMIRRSAENISVTEVEAALSTMPELEEVAVHGVKDEMRGEEVKACIVLKPGYTPETVPPKRVIEHCRQHLARFKVPRYVQYYYDLPRTGSNKVAKKLLVEGKGTVRTEVFDNVSSGAKGRG